jgi:catechol 2,3-dioxygenase-like lactoylglutathione lyase family enzyme
MRISLIVLRCVDILKSKVFYEQFGLQFVEEKHGDGPKHFSSQIGETVLELYPIGKNQTIGLRFGLAGTDQPFSPEQIEKI